VQRRSFYATVKPDVFGRNLLIVAGGFLSPPRRSPDIDPVRCLVTSALVSLVFNKGFQQNWRESLAAVPVMGQLASGKGQNLRSQPFAFDPRQDQKAGIVDHQLQVFLTLRLTLADEFFPVLQLPGACAKADAGHQLVTREYVVANLATRHGCITQVMVTRDIFDPQP
jgi:hypothetical protein